MTVCRHKKQMDISFSCICPLIDKEFRHNVVKVVDRSTQLSPHGSTATLTMLGQNSRSIQGKTHKKTDVNLFIVPPIGDPKQLDTPTAHAAANISVFLDSFCKLIKKPP